ncbi:MAG: phosphodiester glycosidase family protein, partial [Gelidibacter sp.]
MNISKIIFIFFSLLWADSIQSQDITLNWKPRKDLNTELPSSIKIYDSYGILPDGKPLRAMYAEIDLRDKNLKFRSVGSHSNRETTAETYQKNNGILAINGGYFASDSSVSLIIEDGEIISKGSHKTPRGAFGMENGKPEVVWTTPASTGDFVYKLSTINEKKPSQKWLASQAVGGGPVLLIDGQIQLTASEEGFANSHTIRHPRSAIGYKNDHTMVILVVDGRQEASAGATLVELAEIMQKLGAKAAVNLDGGGSSAMIAANEVVNVPVNISGGNRNELRENAGALIISEIVSSKIQTPIYLDTEDATYSEIGIWKDSNLFNYYGTSASRVAVANPMNKAYYHFTDLSPKKYQLGAWFTVDTAENSSEVEYILHRSTQTDTLKVDQSDLNNLGKWTILGDFQLKPEDWLEIRSLSGKQFISDALRLIPSADIPEVPKRGDLRIAVISDLNSGLGAVDYEWQVDSIIQRIPRIWKPDLVISGGDLVAGMGISDTAHLQRMWDGFTKHIAEPLNKNGIPFAFSLGNHDGPRSYKIEHDFTRAYWNQSVNKPDLDFVDDSHFPNYYSFVKNDVFFVSWEASSPIVTEENLKWMEEQFELQAAKNAKFRFVMGHMPLYSVAQERDSKGDVLENPERLRALLERYKVHTYISGHQHAFYPGKRGKLQLLNTGAAGSGARSWLTQELPPTNTITIMDVFYDSGEIDYTTYEIKEKKASDMQVFDIQKLPSAIFGVNGYVLRNDREKFKEGKGNFHSIHGQQKASESGEFSAMLEGKELKISGNFSLPKTQKNKNVDVGLFSGRHNETGTLIQKLQPGKIKNGEGHFSGTLSVTENLEDLLAVGAVYISVSSKSDSLRGQLYPSENKPPKKPLITSHQSKNTYGIRNLNVLGTVKWTPATDPDGDFVTYTYQIASDPEFLKVIYQKETGRNATLKFEEKEWFQLLKESKMGEIETMYHRILATDG